MKVSKRAVIQAWLARQQPTIFGTRESAAVRLELRRVGAGQVTSRYLRDVVEASGVEVAPELGGLPRDLLALIHIETLFDAESALARLEELRQSSTNRITLDALRLAGRRAREKASLVGRNPRVNHRLRQQWEEIAAWLVVWLQIPDLFANWLELRKKSPEFQARFAL